MRTLSKTLLVIAMATAHVTLNAAEKVLILGPTVSGGMSSFEAQTAIALGFEVEVVNDPEWRAKTAAEFTQYRALILGDTGSSSSSLYAAALDTVNTWSPSVNGNVILIGTDPIEHNGTKLIENGIAFVSSRPLRTGLYFCFSDAFGTQLIDLGALGEFQSEDAACNDNAHIVAFHPALDTLTDGDLAGWVCSVHNTFAVSTLPPDFKVLAMAIVAGGEFEAPDGSIGEAYILAKGDGLRLTSDYLSLAVDAKDNVWVSGLGRHQKFSLYDPVTGLPITPTLGTPIITAGRGGFGNLIDRQGQLWSAKPNAGLVRLNGDGSNQQNYNPIDATPPPPFGFGDYNLGLDPITGKLWIARNGDPVVSFADTSLPTDIPFKYRFPQPGNAPFPDVVGLAVDRRGNVWLANPDGVNRVAHLRTDGTLLGWVNLPCTQSPGKLGPRGIAVDANGKVWVPDFTSGKVFRIDPDAGPLVLKRSDGPIESQHGQRLGEVDLTVDLGTGAFPDAYSDMAGMVSAINRPDSGTWNVVHDSGASRTWQKIRWTQVLAANTELKVQVRAAGGNNGSATELLNQNFTTVTASTLNETVTRNLSALSGRFLEIKVTMTRLAGAAAGATPILKDLSVTDTANLPDLPPDNQIPVAQADFFTLTRNSTDQALDVLKNDLLKELSPTEAHITSVSAPAFGTVKTSADAKSLLYTPAPGFHGEDSFTYTIEDDNRAIGSAVAKITVIQLDVSPGHLPPLPNDDSYPEAGSPLILGNSGPVTLDVMANDSSGLTLSAPVSVAESGRFGGLWSDGYDHTVRVYSYVTIAGTRYYSPNYVQATANTLDYGGIYWQWDSVPGAEGYRVLKATADPMSPMGFDFHVDTAETLLPDGDPELWTEGSTVLPAAFDTANPVGLVLLSITQPRHGVARIVNCNQVEYTPSPYFVGTDTFAYLVSNGSAEPREAKVKITVSGDAPKSIVCGQTMSGTLAISDMLSPARQHAASGAFYHCDTYYLDVTSGRQVNLVVTPSGGTPLSNPHLIVRTAQGGIIPDNDSNPADRTFTPRANGTMTIEVSSDDSLPPQEGDYALTTDCPSIRVVAEAVGLANGDTLNFGTLEFTVTQRKQVPLTIFNDGTSVLTIPEFNIVPSTLGLFGIGLNAVDTPVANLPGPFIINPGASQTFYLTYEPSEFQFPQQDNAEMSFEAQLPSPLPSTAFSLILKGQFIHFGYSVEIVAPANESQFVAPTQVQILAEVVQNGWGIQHVDFFARRTDQAGDQNLGRKESPPYLLAATLEPGEYLLFAVVEDNFIHLPIASPPVLIRVDSVPVVNNAPVAANDTRAIIAATVDNVIDALANDSDPDGDSLVVTQFRQAINGVATYDEVQKRFTYTPRAGFSGDDSFSYTITDQHGGTDSAIVTIHVTDSSIQITSPTESSPFQLPVAGGGISIDATATATVGTTVTRVRFFVDNQMIGQDTTASGTTYSFTWPNPTPGDHLLTAALVDSEGRQRYSQPVRITIFDIEAPTVTITSPLNEDTATLPVTVGDPITVIRATATAASGATMARVKFYVNDELIGEDTSATGANEYSITWSSIRFGTHVLRAVAYDQQGRFKVSAPISITLNRDVNNVPPVAKIICPGVPSAAALEVDLVPRIRRDKLVIRGLAHDPSSQPVTYQILVTDVDGNIVAKTDPVTGSGISTGPSTPCTDPDIDDPNNTIGLVGVVSLTGLLNGRYNANLVVSDQSDVVVDTVCFLLESEAKIGHFTFSQQDLAIPVNGIPLTVVRTYNSRNIKTGDFGYSWTYSILDMDIELDDVRQIAFDADAVDYSDPYSMRVGGGRNVTLTLPNGQRTTFRFEPSVCGSGCFRLKWAAAPGVTATLVPIDRFGNEIGQIYGGFPFVSFESGRTPFQNSDVPGFKLTTQDGTQYILAREDFGERFPLQEYGDEDESGPGQEFANIDVRPYGPPYLSEIIQPSGERIKFQRDGTGANGEPLISNIEHRSANGDKMASLAIKRDSEGRIIAIFDPIALKAGLNANGEPIGRPALNYEYDDAGNLRRVLKLIDQSGTTPTYLTYEFRYENFEYPHLITKIVDGNGLPVAVNEYDDQGRLKRVTDADGFTSTFDREGTPTVGVGVEKVTDHWGNTRTIEYDARGNVVLSVNPLNQKVRRTFDNLNKNTVSETLSPTGTLLGRSDLDIEYFPNSGAVKKVTAKQKKVVNGSIVANQDIVVQKEFSSSGQLLKIVDRMGAHADIVYNEFKKPEQIQTFNSLGQLLQNSSTSHYHASGPFKGLPDYSEDALGNRHINFYYAGNEPESGGTAGRLQKVERRDPQGNLLSLEAFTYDENGNILTTAKARNNATDLQVSQSFYNGLSQVERVIDPELGQSRTFYNSSGQVESVEDRYGSRTSYLYNRKGDTIQTTHADGSISRSTTLYGYGSNGKGSAVIVERPHFEGDPVFGTRTEYNPAGQVIKVEELKNFRIIVTPDGPNHASSFGELVGGAVVISSTTTHYDDAGREDVVTDARGNSTTYTYDGYGRRDTETIWVTTPTGRERSVRTYQYDANGNEQSAALVVTPFSAGNPPTQTGSPVTVPTPSFQYDALNRRWLTTHPDGSYSRSIYDELGRRVEEIEPDGVSTRFEYDSVGRLLAVTKPYKLYNPTSLNNYLSPQVTDANPLDQTITRYKYDLAGNLIRQTDANQTVVTPETAQKHTIFEYDKLGRRTKRILPGAQQETWQFDTTVASQLIQQIIHTDFNQVSILEEFDNMGRLRRKTPQVVPLPAGWVPLEFTYTATGNRRTMSEASGLTEYEYDDQDRLWRKTVEKGTLHARTLTYAYDANGNIGSITSSSGETTLNYAYDERNRLISANDTSYSYDPAGNLKTVTYPNLVTTRYNYDNRNRLGIMTVKDGLNATLASFEYDDYDNTDTLNWPTERRLARTGERQGAAELIKFGGQDYRRLLAYDHDPLKRLRAERLRTATGASWPSWAPNGVPITASTGDILYDVTAGYGDLSSGKGYDRVGNRRSRTVTDPALINKGITDYSGGTAQTFDVNDRLTGGINESDANGNTKVGELLPVSGTVNPSTATAETRDQYDYENRLIKRSDGITTVTIIYDGDGNRVRKTVNIGSDTTVVRYLVDDRNPTGYAQVLEEWKNVNGAPATLQRAYIYGHDLISQRQANGTIHYYGYDGHGNVRLLLGDNGIVTDAYSYDAFGVLVHELHQDTLNPTPNNYLYSGEQWDPHLGMYFQRARYLNPRNGRFWTMDSFEGNVEEPLSLHKYLYTSGNPVNRVDPSGKFEIIISVLSMAADVLRYALHPGRTFDVSPDTGFIVDQEELDNADEEALIAIHIASQEWLLLTVNNEVRRGLAEMADAEDAKWDAFFAVWDFNEEVIWDLIESVSYVQACFVAGTPVAMGVNPDGTYITRPIEDLRPDDLVLARDENNAQAVVRLQRIQDIYSREVNHLRAVAVSHKSGRATIRATDEHPIWVEDRGWTPAGELVPGDKFSDASGNATVVVLSSEREDLTHPVQVYNFRVETDHTYFLSDAVGAGRLTVWVHNVCKGAVQPNKNANGAKSQFGVYEIRAPDGTLHKIGKADLNRKTLSSGYPTRLHQQLRQLNDRRPPGSQYTGEVVEKLGETTTAIAKMKEKVRLLDVYNKSGGKFIPPGNRKSFFPPAYPY